SLILKSGRDRSLRNRHPWVYSGGVKERPKAGTGAIVAVRDNQGNLLGHGHYAPDTSLICRVFDFGQEEKEFDGAYWEGKLAEALVYRKRLAVQASNTCFRLIHAEGDGMPGVVLDVYGNAAALQLRTKGAFQLVEHITSFLRREMGIEHIFLQTDRRGKEEVAGKWILGGIDEVEVVENGIRFLVNIADGQKTGFFIDQRVNRSLLQKHANGARVLNAFSYTGGFSAFALAGGAAQVDSVDISAAAIEMANRNVALNFGPDAKHQGIKADCFQFLKDMPKDAYDLIVLDPPAFTKHISTVKKAARGYKEINLRALQKIESGGLIYTFSCSQHISKDLFRKIVFGAAADAGREVRVVAQLEQSPDHPVSIYHPEGEYLKGLVLNVV
ncbi:UNVERIFIED_CONTAM: hypothetical protein GTU68_057420, partial [Idotea baltica]|nr:hypothetical protein [Idotea baltica]